VVVVNGVLDPIGGTIVTDELNRLERDLYLADQRDGVVRTGSQRRAAALVEMATRSATAAADGKRPRPVFTVFIGDDSFTRMCELANGQVITPGTLIPWLGDAELETVLFDGPTTVVSVSKRRPLTGALRRAIQVRDRHCQHPSGCDEPVDRCDVDHVIPVAENGPTSSSAGGSSAGPTTATQRNTTTEPSPCHPGRSPGSTTSAPDSAGETATSSTTIKTTTTNKPAERAAARPVARECEPWTVRSSCACTQSSTTSWRRNCGPRRCAGRYGRTRRSRT
jgi:hypothetical protein